jgi:uncharacterized membrane protein
MEDININIAQDNGQVLNYLLENNDLLNELIYCDNYLYYKDQSIDLSETNLKLLLFGNQYGKFVADLKANKINSKALFDFIKINSVTIEDYNDNKRDNLINYALEYLNKGIKEDEDNYDIINTEHYFRIVSNPNGLDNKELASINKYEEYVALLMQYVQENPQEDTEDYLNKEQNRLVHDYIISCKSIQESKPNSPLIAKYNDILTIAQQEKEKQKKLELKQENISGFANAMLVIFLMVITGIIMGICSYYFISPKHIANIFYQIIH